MSAKVVIEAAAINGRHDQYLQRVATIYHEGRDYRLYVPAKATGKTIEWVEQMCVRELSADGAAEIPVGDDLAMGLVNLAIKELKQEQIEGDFWDWGKHPNARFYYAQICLHGHVITCNGRETKAGEHCQICGSRCIIRCEKCNAPIRGKGVMSGSEYILPLFCYSCAKPYPWMQDRLDTAKELLFHDDKLTLEDREGLWNLLQYVLSDPKSDMVPAKRKLIEIKLAPALAATREFILEFLAKSVAEMAKP